MAICSFGGEAYSFSSTIYDLLLLSNLTYSFLCLCILPLFQAIPPEAVEQCTGARNICQQLYDTAPSGRYGSMTYMCRALAHIIHLPASNGDIECAIS